MTVLHLAILHTYAAYAGDPSAPQVCREAAKVIADLPKQEELSE